MTILINNVRNVAARIGAVRAMSTSPPPRMHKAKDAWHRIKETRPPEGHPHVSFSTVLIIYVVTLRSLRFCDPTFSKLLLAPISASLSIAV